MAIDTRAKRMSMLSFASPLAWQNHFEVDGSVDADDRAQLLHLYGGNAFDSPVIPPPPTVPGSGSGRTISGSGGRAAITASGGRSAIRGRGGRTTIRGSSG